MHHLGNEFVDPGDKPKALSHPGPPGRRASAVDRLQVATGGAAYDVLPARGDDPLASDEERAVDPIEVERLEAPHDVPDRRGVERDVVGVAPHEADLLRVHADLGLVPGHQSAAAPGTVGPEEDLVALEMTAGADQRQAPEERQ